MYVYLYACMCLRMPGSVRRHMWVGIQGAQAARRNCCRRGVRAHAADMELSGQGRRRGIRTIENRFRPHAGSVDELFLFFYPITILADPINQINQ